MQDRDKTKEQLIDDIREMRERLAALESASKNRAGAGRPDARSGEIERNHLYFFQSNPHPMWVYDQETLAFLAVNDAAIAHYGYQREEFLAMTIKDIRPQKDVSRLLDLVARPLEGFKETGSWRHRKKDGTIIDVEITSHSLDFAGRKARLVLAQDITMRKRAEEALKESEQRFKILSEASFEGIAFSEKGVLLDVNEQLANMLGYERRELIGKPVLEVVAPEHRDLVQEAIRTGRLEPYEHVMMRKNGDTFPVEIRARLAHIGGREIRLTAIRDITERKRAEERLRRSEELLQRSQHIAHVGSWEFNIVSNSLFWSDEIFRIFDIGPDKFGASYEAFLEMVHPEDREMVNRAYKDSVKDREPYDIVHRLLLPDGRVKFVQERCETFYDPAGNPVRSIGAVQDITERKQAEEAARRSGETLEKTFRSLDSALFILDNGNPPVVSECNPAATRIFGYEKDEMLGQTTEFLHADKEALSEFQMNMYAALKERGVLSSFEFRMKRRNGEIFPTEHSVIPLLDDLGNRTGWISVVRDVTERRRAERQTRDALGFIRTMMESSPIGMVSIKATGAVVAVNKAISEITGGTVDQLLKRNVRDLEPWKKYGLLAAMDEALATNSERQVETYYVSTFGKQAFLSIRFVPYTFEGEPHVLTLLADVSDRKRHEAEKEKLQSQLLQAQKMEAVGRLAGGIAHDFNNILTVIIGYGHMALRELREDDPVRANLDEMLLSADRAAALTQSLLAFGRKQILDPQKVDLNTIINKVQKLLIRVIGEDIALKTTLSDDPLIIFADAIQMEQVLLNLATNARDAMPDGGKLYIETQRIDVDDVYVKTHGYGEIGPYAMLTMTDTGGGIEPDIKEHIFEPFFTTKEKGKGTGLGLSIMYGIVKQHRGHIAVYSEIGKGTSFKVLFPMSEIRDSAAQLLESSAAPPRGTEVVLLAEDDASVRRLNKRILEEFGYRVIEAVDGQDALDKLAQNRNAVQLLILDVIMPGMNGKEVYEAAKAMDPRIKALFTSGYPADHIQKKGVLEEGLHFITKPAGPREFLAKIRSVLES